MPKRTALSKKTRFEVFKRDSFTCQYCGAMAPDSVLHCGHIIPVKEGGDNSIQNLVTACAACNLGKGARKLSDTAAVKKAKKQADEINARLEQIQMMADWQKGLQLIRNEQMRLLEIVFFDGTDSCFLGDEEIVLKKLLARFSFEEVFAATEIARDRYLEHSVEKAISKIGGICWNRRHREGKK